MWEAVKTSKVPCALDGQISKYQVSQGSGSQRNTFLDLNNHRGLQGSGFFNHNVFVDVMVNLDVNDDDELDNFCLVFFKYKFYIFVI